MSSPSLRRLESQLRHCRERHQELNDATKEKERVRNRIRANKIYHSHKGKIADNLFSRLRWHLLRAQKDNRTEFGCSVFELRAHIESQFRDGMTWRNYGKEWEMDHVCSRQNYTEKDMLFCFHYTNMRPRLTHLNKLDSILYQRRNQQP